MGAKKPLTPEVTIIGCGTPTPLPDRFGSSYVVQIGDEKLLFDCGPATTWKLARAGIKTTEIDNVFFTHHHFDHDADFPTFILTRWDQMIPRDRLLNVYGPKLTEEFTNGTIDEIRISSRNQPADWISAQYSSMMDAFITFGSVEAAP